MLSKRQQKLLDGLYLPPKILIGPQVWTIEYAKADDAGMQRAWGITSADEHKIRMTPPVLTPGFHKYFEVCIHELLHAVWSINRDFNRKMTEEDFAVLGGMGLSSLFVDNPKLVVWFLNCLNAIAAERKGVQ